MANIVHYPLSTEKSIRLMEAENKLVFVVERKAKKHEIQRALEELYNVKIVSINTLITPGGKKRAYVKFHDESPAIDLATKLGLM
ncbi:MAG: 50S ribosomal protein L23 [Nanobdellota archaeon]